MALGYTSYQIYVFDIRRYIYIYICTHIYFMYTIYIYIYIFFHVQRVACKISNHVRSASTRGNEKGLVATWIDKRILEKGTEYFIRIRGFKPNAKRAQYLFNIRFERIKLERGKRLSTRQHEKLSNVRRDTNERPLPRLIGSILTFRQKKAQLLSRKRQNFGPY